MCKNHSDRMSTSYRCAGGGCGAGSGCRVAMGGMAVVIQVLFS